MTRKTNRWRLVAGAAVVVQGAVFGCGGLTGVSESGDGAVPPSADAAPIMDGGAPDGSQEASVCMLQASSYDQSCNVSSDCVAWVNDFPVQFDNLYSNDAAFNYCQPQTCLCGGDSINRASADQYASDLARTPLGSGAVAPVMCGCPLLGSCCVAGRCSTGAACSVAYDGGPRDGRTLPEGSVLCSYYEGVLDADIGDAGPSRWCSPRQSCLPNNGGWECCDNGGIALCTPPVVVEGD